MQNLIKYIIQERYKDTTPPIFIYIYRTDQNHQRMGTYVGLIYILFETKNRSR